MSDLRLVPNGIEAESDLVVAPTTSSSPTAYLEDETLETPIRLSLFTNARAQAGDELPEGSGAFGEDLGGYWGDAFLENPLGSRLWLLRRSALTSETRQRARDYAVEALRWLVLEGIASSVEVETAIPERGRLALYVTVTREGETPSRFQYVWESLKNGTN